MAALRGGDMGAVLEAEETLLSLGKEREALRSRQARETRARVLPILDASQTMDFAAQAEAIERAFAPLLPAVSAEMGEEAARALMADHEPLDGSGASMVAGETVAPGTQKPWEPDWKESTALRYMDPDTDPPALSLNPTIASIQKQQDALRQKRIGFYHGEAPKPATDQPVWEAGQGRKEWSGKEKPEQKRYYVIGKRPLDFPGLNGLYGRSAGENRDVEHTQFIANDGSNRGLFPEGFRAEKDALQHQYAYADDKRYNAELIDVAMKEVEEEMTQKRGTKNIYHKTHNNCQHYTEFVVKKAERIAQETGTALFVD